MSDIQYQGRQARREGSEQRRRSILEAALRIIVREGIRNVRHRAVAKEADVPLSATTYYFKDISDLIADTFTLFAEQAMEDVIEPFREQAFGLLEQFDSTRLQDAAERLKLMDSLADMTTFFLYQESRDKRDHLIAEQAFIQEAVLDERLRDLALVYTNKLVEVLQSACEKLGTAEPAQDAQLMWASITSMEQKLLLDPAFSMAELRVLVRRMLELFMTARHD
ncbi:MAG: TetR family transcriptional regulator [Alcanivoracaceae bacterium]|jgi:DNA-binding transcriptional regulator YbjK|nr:TetR family transcriptional regulator [Alcanivoracaceae bacterium]